MHAGEGVVVVPKVPRGVTTVGAGHVTGAIFAEELLHAVDSVAPALLRGHQLQVGGGGAAHRVVRAVDRVLVLGEGLLLQDGLLWGLTSTPKHQGLVCREIYKKGATPSKTVIQISLQSHENMNQVSIQRVYYPK